MTCSQRFSIHGASGMPRPDRRGPGGPGARSICGSPTAAARIIPTRIWYGRPLRRRVFRPQQPKHLSRDGTRCLCGAALRGRSIVWLGGRVSVWSARCAYRHARPHGSCELSSEGAVLDNVGRSYDPRHRPVAGRGRRERPDACGRFPSNSTVLSGEGSVSP